MADDPCPPDELAGPGEGDDEIIEVHRPLWYRAGLLLLVVALVLFLVPAVAHVFFPPVNPAQTPPPGHFTSGCWACHDVSANTPVKSFD